LVQNPEKTHRVAVLDEDLCQPRKCGLECIIYCPVNKTGGECIVQRETDGKAVISEDLCTGCGICVKKCPFDAIVIVNLAKELGTDKMHQFGINSFRLYRLPIPKKGHVVGLLGKNGIGKSTIVNILSGNVRPNFGNYNKDPTSDEIIDRFQGMELKSHFEKILNGTIRSSIKPQMVSMIPKFFKGTGQQLLDKYDERKEYDRVISQLGLHNSLDRNLGELSGGELQRIAVAVAAVKDADYYFFDEPSSYNDVYQRLAIARVIRELAKEGRSVMVVEHDIGLLDYLSDYIHILYGEPGAYGIVSTLQGTKIGINSFLEGFLPSENIRFRDKSYTFDIKGSSEEQIPNKFIAEYSDLRKSFLSFSVVVSAGRIREGEIVGVVGANALGKTTFMKMLAGVEKPDEGHIKRGSTVSFKPQYLNNDYDSTVISLLMTAYQNIIEGSHIEGEIIFPLGIKRLYEKSVRNLSGGELQKVAIAACLIREADIYALDEPSAFLDIEDRIALAKFLHRFVRGRGKTAIVIDHDMQLVDLLADSLLFFQGEPGLRVTYRRDETTGRPRINKEGGRLDRLQKEAGQFYYLDK
jgi:ATP-binding cassette subfamily E protein 1